MENILFILKIMFGIQTFYQSSDTFTHGRNYFPLVQHVNIVDFCMTLVSSEYFLCLTSFHVSPYNVFLRSFAQSHPPSHDELSPAPCFNSV